MKRSFTVKPKTNVTAASHARDKIGGLENRIADLRARLAEPDLAEDERIDLGQELAELEEQLNFAWQDDEAEYDYAIQQQEFNPDGSLKGYDDYEAPDNDLYEVTIWYEVDPGHDAMGPQAATEVLEYYADSPDEAIEFAKRDWDGPIDRLEITAVNPEYDDVDLPYASDKAEGQKVEASEKVEAAEESYTYADFMDTGLEDDIAYKLGLYIDWSAVRGEGGPIFICDDPDHENNSDMWDGSDEDILRKMDFSDYKDFIEEDILTHPQEEWAKLYKSYLQDLGDPTVYFDEDFEDLDEELTIPDFEDPGDIAPHFKD